MLLLISQDILQSLLLIVETEAFKKGVWEFTFMPLSSEVNAEGALLDLWVLIRCKSVGCSPLCCTDMQ